MAENLVMLPAFFLVAALICGLVAGLRHRGRRVEVALYGAAVLAVALMVVSAPNVAVVEKLLTRLIQPIGLIWLLGYGVIWWFLVTARRRAAMAVLVIWLVYSLAGNGWVGGLMMNWLEAGYSPPAPDARFDAVIVLGGGTGVATWGEPQLSVAGDRLRVGAELHRRGQTPLLITSGSSVAGLSQLGQRDLTGETTALWRGMGVPDDAILAVPGPQNTRTEIIALGELAAERGWKRLGLVTSAWHLRRATRLAERHGVAVIPIPADSRGLIPPASANGVIPSASSAFAIQVAWKEIVGALVGR